MTRKSVAQVLMAVLLVLAIVVALPAIQSAGSGSTSHNNPGSVLLDNVPDDTPTPTPAYVDPNISGGGNGGG
jgi:hypothetical protein